MEKSKRRRSVIGAGSRLQVLRIKVGGVQSRLRSLFLGFCTGVAPNTSKSKANSSFGQLCMLPSGMCPKSLNRGHSGTIPEITSSPDYLPLWD
jgi:hypothetical protein